MTGREVVEQIKQKIGVPWREQSYRDTFKFGDPDTPIKGIATTMMVTFGMLKRANEAGLNMVISHEPTFWNDRDDTKDLLNDPLYQAKTGYMRENGMVIWRFHDHMHAMEPDYTVVGSLRSVGVKGGENAGMHPGALPIPRTTLGEFASQAKRRSGARAVRCVGEPKANVSKVLLGPGYATPGMTVDTDIVVGGEQQEVDGLFDNVQYVADAASLGIPKGLIMLGHVVSEQAGMEDLGKWMQTFIKGVPIQFVPADEPYWT
jgi:putative NIF3 family GTP cyclohydrolase 1 type 2